MSRYYSPEGGFTSQISIVLNVLKSFQERTKHNSLIYLVSL